MKKVIVAIMISLCGIATAQEVEKDTVKTISIDSLQRAINEHKLKFDALDEKLSPLQEEVDRMSKLKISGYMQVQYEMYDYQDVPTSGGMFQLKPGSYETNVPLTTNSVDVTNTFNIRRARVKFTYKPIEGVAFVLQPNFTFSSVTLKDAYVQLNDPWLNTFQLWVGQFNRPDYEVEFSSRDRIILERSRMSSILYPQERDLGAKLVVDFSAKYEVPLKFDFAVLNGNFGEGPIGNQVIDVDNQKDIMVRATYSLKFPQTGLGIDFGGNGYFGKNTVFAAGTFSGVDNKPFTAEVGDKLGKHWYGAELQLFYDIFGGIALKSQFNKGVISGTAGSSVINNNPNFNFSAEREFFAYYTVLEKNFGTKYQAAARYDSWDPNTRLSKNDVTIAHDLKIHTWSFALSYFFTNYTKISLGYSMPINETSSTIGGIYNDDIKNNTTTLRFQVNF